MKTLDIFVHKHLRQRKEKQQFMKTHTFIAKLCHIISRKKKKLDYEKLKHNSIIIF